MQDNLKEEEWASRKKVNRLIFSGVSWSILTLVFIIGFRMIYDVSWFLGAIGMMTMFGALGFTLGEMFGVVMRVRAPRESKKISDNGRAMNMVLIVSMAIFIPLMICALSFIQTEQLYTYDGGEYIPVNGGENMFEVIFEGVSDLLMLVYISSFVYLMASFSFVMAWKYKNTNIDGIKEISLFVRHCEDCDCDDKKECEKEGYEYIPLSIKHVVGDIWVSWDRGQGSAFSTFVGAYMKVFITVRDLDKPDFMFGGKPAFLLEEKRVIDSKIDMTAELTNSMYNVIPPDWFREVVSRFKSVTILEIPEVIE